MPTKKPTDERTPLAIALEAYERVRSYDNFDMSPNERAIIALGDELHRLQAAARRQPGAKPYPPGVPATARRED